MRRHTRRRTLAWLMAMTCTLLAACGDEDAATPTPDIIAGGPQDPCRALSQSAAGRVLGNVDLEAGVAASIDECSYSSRDGSLSLVFDQEDRKLFDLALSGAAKSQATVQPVTGLGDQAFFYTPRPSSSSPGAGAITYLKVAKGSRYFTVLVRRGERYDQELEKRAADGLLHGV